LLKLERLLFLALLIAVIVLAFRAGRTSERQAIRGRMPAKPQRRHIIDVQDVHVMSDEEFHERERNFFPDSMWAFLHSDEPVPSFLNNLIEEIADHASQQ